MQKFVKDFLRFVPSHGAAPDFQLWRFPFAVLLSCALVLGTLAVLRFRWEAD